MEAQNITFFEKDSKINVEHVNYFREYTYDDETTYNGSIFESWPPTKNRSVERYLNYNFTHQPPSHKIENKTILLMVQSHPSERNYRNIWRKAYHLQSQTNLSIVFIIACISISELNK